MTPESFQAKFTVSRETIDHLIYYCDELTRWNKKINLVSPKTIESLWDRHIVDSAQVFSHFKSGSKSIVDLGSGGGFPAIVLAIMAQELAPDLKFTLIESDSRKCSFLRFVSRETNLGLSVLNQRIEKPTEQIFDIVTARALAPLDKLFVYAEPLKHEETQCLFLKGKDHNLEIIEAKKNWSFNPKIIGSMTNSESAIVGIESFQRA